MNEKENNNAEEGRKKINRPSQKNNTMKEEVSDFLYNHVSLSIW
jgi:sarcosine oxidase delta subunit